MAELVVSVSAGTLLMIGSGVALRSTERLINDNKGKTTLRQNTANGMRLMRSEIERSMHLVLNRTESIGNEYNHTDLNNPDYTRVLNECQSLSPRFFKPIFGTKMIELAEPVVYGITTSKNGRGYTLQRCGAPLSTDGRYQENQTLFISPVLDNLAALPCSKDIVDRNECPDQKPLEEILQDINFKFTDGKTPYRSTSEPAMRIETDINSKLVKFIDPTPDDDTIKAVYLQKVGSGSKSTTILPTHFAAFARADKRINGNGADGNGGVLTGAFFKNITSKRLRFVLDGSGSMSACVMWGEGYGNKRTYYDPKRGSYIRKRQNCAFTRMEAMQNELTTLLTNLSEDSKIGLHSFSTSGRKNNKNWAPSSNGLVTISEPGMRESAIAFVNTLDDSYPGDWGGTKPWKAIQDAFNDTEVDTLYLLSDGQPNNDPWGGSWRTNDHDKTAQHYSAQNSYRDIELKVNTTSLGLSSPWMEKLSDLTNGDYNQIDQQSLREEDNIS
ncbi:VWA domain-containing protein [bacterium]|nr:VWA domain-containing protein [bacterium]